MVSVLPVTPVFVFPMLTYIYFGWYLRFISRSNMCLFWYVLSHLFFSSDTFFVYKVFEGVTASHCHCRFIGYTTMLQCSCWRIQWDYSSFVAKCVMPLEEATRRWVYYCNKEMVITKHQQQNSCRLKCWHYVQLGIKAPECQENNHYTITPPAAAAWTVNKSQDGSIPSCSSHLLLSLPSECCSLVSLDQAMCSHSVLLHLLEL